MTSPATPGASTGGANPASAPSSGSNGNTGTPGPTAPVVDAGPSNVGSADAAAGALALPCDVQKVLKDKCQTCHSDPPVGAPIPLTTLAHLQAASAAKPGEKVHQRVKARINESGATSMPPPARPALTAAEKATLETFLDGGAQGVASAACAFAMGDAGVPPVDQPEECDLTMELRAQNGQTANDTTPFMVPGNGDTYEMFWFAPTWTEKVQVTQVTPLIDNGSVLHHWLLYMKENGTETPGSHHSELGLQPEDSQLLSGWAPGSTPHKLPSDVGFQVVQGPAGRFGIEIHYNTSANPTNRADRSGAKLCVTKKIRPKEAATHWLGTQVIFSLFGGKFDASGVCTVMQESHIIAHSPHMHKTGRYMKSIITKADGSKVTITDKPFAFEDQQIYPIDEIIVRPGDRIDTTCSYDAPGPMTFGPGTDSEMCYNFITAYPVGSLSNGVPGIVGGKNTCIDGL